MKRLLPLFYSGIIGFNLCCAGVIYGVTNNGYSLWIMLVAMFFTLGALTGLLATLFPRHISTQAAARWATPWAFLASTLAALVALTVLVGILPVACNEYLTVVPNRIGLLATNFSTRLDPLAAFFILVVFGVAALVSIYSSGYLFEEGNSFQPGLIATSYNLFLLTMFLTLISDNIFWLLLLWGVMTLVSSFMVLYKHNRLLPQLQQRFLNRHQMMPPSQSVEHTRLQQLETSRDSEMAVVVYFIAGHASSLLLALSLLIVAWFTHSFNFTTLRQHATLLYGSPALHLVFVLAFLGLGIKAGIAPFHVWLPYAHPASPANAHALMSGTMIKLSVYLLIRLFFDILGPEAIHPVWGLLVMMAGALTAIVGVLYAVVSHDLKETLAYHSIENMGIILVGLGVAFLAASPPQHPALIQLGLAAALLHVMNHAVFKSLLFLATGTIERVAGSTFPAQLGGLLRNRNPKRIRWVAWSFLVGAIAIAGFPPFNGFVSKWLTIQALLAQISTETRQITAPGPGMVVPILFTSVAAVLLLGLSFALTAYCFVKITGQSLLGHGPKHGRPLQPRRVQPSMLVVLAILSAVCLLLGVWGLGFNLTLKAVNSVLHNPVPETMLQPAWDMIHISGSGFASQTALAELALLLTVVGLAVALLSRLFRWVDLTVPTEQTLLFEPWRYGDSPWSTQEYEQPAELQFTSPAFTYLVRQVFRHFYRHRTVLLPEQLHHSYLNHKFILTSNPDTGQETVVIELFRYGYNVLAYNLIRFAGWIGNRFQNGDLREYITYIIAVYIIVILIGVLQIW